MSKHLERISEHSPSNGIKIVEVSLMTSSVEHTANKIY